MKILHLLSSPAFSGPAELITELALAQRAAGHDVAVAVDRKRTSVQFEEPALPRLERAGLAAGLPLTLSVKSSPVELARDVGILRGADVEVLHAHFSHDHLLASIARRSGVRLIRSVHAPRSLHRLTPGADGWTVPYPGLARALLGQRVMVLPPLVPASFVPAEDRIRARAALGVDASLVVGMVSTFQPSRRHDLALDAFSLVATHRPDARLLLVGDGPLEPSLRARAAGSPASGRVDFAGYRSGDELVRRLQVMDVVWVLGLGNDFSGRAAAQARACGARVVAVDEGGLPAVADVTVSPDAEEIATATLALPPRRTLSLHTAAEVASRLVELYL